MRKSFMYLAVVVASLSASPALATDDEDLAVVVDPRTGAVGLRNDSGSTLNIDGYLFESLLPTFDTSTWQSFEDGSVAGWFEGQANDSVLSEVNLTTSLSIAPNETVSIGNPYSVFAPSAFGEAEPEFSVSFSVENVGVFDGEVEFVNDNNIVLVVDRATGAARLENQSEFDVSFSSYLIQSASGALDLVGWAPLQDNTDFAGWTATPGSPSILGEANLSGASLLVASGGSAPLGAPIDPSVLTDESDLILQFSAINLGADPIAGDFNNDGSVDAADYTVWRDNLGVAEGSLLGGNGNGGLVDITDYELWVNNFGSTATGGESVAFFGGVLLEDSSIGAGVAASAVPEPGSLAVLLLGCCAGGVRRATRRN